MSEWAQLERWHDFYLLIGGAAATLMGLTFVAVTLAPEIIGSRASDAVRAFVTPVVAFFATILIVSATMLIPLLTPSLTCALLAIVGIAGVVYIPMTNVHGEWRKNELGLDDWVWYIGLPFLSYAIILFSAVGWWRMSAWGSVADAAALICLLTAGIRNAWDLVLTLAREKQQ